MSQQSYKIFTNHNFYLITDSSNQSNTDSDLISMSEDEFLSHVKSAKFESDLPGKNYLVRTSKPKKLVKSLMKEILTIKAAGGIVHNPMGEVLHILRKGKWDLPKGKKDEGENSKQTAVREVSEECGIPLPVITTKAGKTFHVFMNKSKPVLKITKWYNMTSDYTGNFTPQVEENIAEVAYKSPDFILQPDTLTYLNMKELILHNLNND
jgi:8-oxo-(d)GTP phosphatase